MTRDRVVERSFNTSCMDPVGTSTKTRSEIVLLLDGSVPRATALADCRPTRTTADRHPKFVAQARQCCPYVTGSLPSGSVAQPARSTSVTGRTRPAGVSPESGHRGGDDSS